MASIWALADAATVRRAPSLRTGVHVVGVPAETDILSLQLGLKLREVDKLETMLRDVSEPRSPNYGRWLFADEVKSRFLPSQESADVVIAWLEKNDIRDYVDNGFSINFAANISNVNRVLQSAFMNYDVDGTRMVRTLQYTIPDEVANHIELITPTTYFGTTNHQPPAPVLASPGVRRSRQWYESEGCARYTYPHCLHEIHHTKHKVIPDPKLARGVGFASFLNQSAIQTDLDRFTGDFNLPQTKIASILINGAVDHQSPQGPCLEANLDSQMLASVAEGFPMTQYLIGGRPPFMPNLRIVDEETNNNEPYLEFYQYLLNLQNEDIPPVISISYGDDEQTVPMEYAVRTCNLMGMMGLRGISILHGSGDSGVGASCLSNDGTKRPEFTPMFPATCPYVTAVGGTQGWNPQVAWEGSGGGFSKYFKRAWYQRGAVTDYLAIQIDMATKGYYAGYTDFGGRAVPDLAAHSGSPHYSVVVDGNYVPAAGTSAAAPVVAGLITLLNEDRRRAGKPTLGFLNPWLYGSVDAKGKLRQMFEDVATGSATGCNGIDHQTGMTVDGAGIIPHASWNATPGWDPATGLGIPLYDAMLGRIAEGV